MCLCWNTKLDDLGHIAMEFFARAERMLVRTIPDVYGGQLRHQIGQRFAENWRPIMGGGILLFVYLFVYCYLYLYPQFVYALV
jgi:hypothetical protein